MSRTQVYDWYRRFQYGRRSVDSDERSGRPATSRTNKNIADVLEALKRNRKITIRKLSKDVNISYGSVQSIITEDLDIKREPAKVAKMSGTVKNKPATPKKAALKSANSPAKSSVVKPEEASEECEEAETRQETNSEESYQKNCYLWNIKK
ncbi:protein GVQW3 [Octopus sinensis]|uniref:Protein GVQW3 n=1 Tax=Octopus sinensis TaxID=2607531 RepID=A0A6P7TD09_9MOLL|nr:protein GVQW3 [Octopus sinensis]